MTLSKQCNAPVTSFEIPAGPAEIELEIKKSRFIARADAASSREQALAVLQHMRARFPDARHHCWAYQLGAPSSPFSAAMNDDGEPSGTAGKPILNVIQHKSIGNLMVVVSRYFGGVKLGAGGLVRAYSAAAEQAIATLPLTTYEPLSEHCIYCDFAHEQLVRQWLLEQQGEIAAVEYGQEVALTVRLPTTKTAAFVEFLARLGAQWTKND
ncbi:YigZ family protein [Aliidiomarina celeris]|uniref:YigZ family protein n=1 Tax=Aliidiomarina celeris TaxID=2249428 RepID=UPI000DEA9D07|nr:YigZ family protein [Aliidiomarina celeris]